MDFEPSKGLQMPPALVIVSIILVVASVVTLILPKGEYDRVEKFFPNFALYTVVDGDSLSGLQTSFGLEELTVDSLVDHETGEAVSTFDDLTAGTVIRVPTGGGLTRNAVIPDSYAAVEVDESVELSETLVATFKNAAIAPIEGFKDKSDIIGFVIFLGGAFGIIMGTGALDRVLVWLVVAVGDGPLKLLVVPTSMVLFSLGGAVFGLGETTIAFVMITVPLAIRMGYDTVTGICMCYLASQIGFATAFFNPFTIGIAQAIAELPYMSGNGLRYIVWAVATAIGIAFVMWHALKVQRDPTRSPTYKLDEMYRAEHGVVASESSENETKELLPKVSTRDVLIVLCALGSVFVTAFGVQQLNWWISEMAGTFIVFGLIAGIISGVGLRKMVNEFIDGAKLMVEPALIIAISAGIVYVLKEGQVLDTILHGVAQPLNAMGSGPASVSIMGMQAVINFFVPSGSGQAAMTMPITAPLCDIVGLDRQIGVLAYQFGDGFGNMMIPTSAVLMGVLGVARVDWSVWIKWVWPLILGLHVLGACVLLIALALPKEWLM